MALSVETLEKNGGIESQLLASVVEVREQLQAFASQTVVFALKYQENNALIKLLANDFSRISFFASFLNQKLGAVVAILNMLKSASK